MQFSTSKIKCLMKLFFCFYKNYNFKKIVNLRSILKGMGEQELVVVSLQHVQDMENTKYVENLRLYYLQWHAGAKRAGFIALKLRENFLWKLKKQT